MKSENAQLLKVSHNVEIIHFFSAKFQRQNVKFHKILLTKYIVIYDGAYQVLGFFHQKRRHNIWVPMGTRNPQTVSEYYARIAMRNKNTCSGCAGIALRSCSFPTRHREAAAC